MSKGSFQVPSATVHHYYVYRCKMADWYHPTLGLCAQIVVNIVVPPKMRHFWMKKLSGNFWKDFYPIFPLSDAGR